MRRLALVSVLGIALASLGAEAAPFSATLSFSDPWSHGPIVFTGAGSGSSTAGLVTLPADVFAGTLVVPITGASPISVLAVSLAGNSKGAVLGSPLAGQAALRGLWRMGEVGVLGTWQNFLTMIGVPLVVTSHTGASATARHGVGLGGTVTHTRIIISGVPYFSRKEFLPWTAGAVSLSVPYEATYTIHGPMSGVATYTYTLTSRFMATGSDARTPSGLGQITLVSPVRVFSPYAEPFVLDVRLALEFVPEPGTALLLGTAVAALGVMGRRRRSRLAR